MSLRSVATGALVVGVAVLAMPRHDDAVGATRPNWIGEVSAAYAQQTGATMKLPSAFSGANLLVAVVANDGPDSNAAETHAVFGGSSRLTWTRNAHISARQDWATAGAALDIAGASSTEVWTASPPRGWTPGTVSEISNWPELRSATRDDGGAITIAAFATGKLGQVMTVDGLNSRPENQSFDTIGARSAILAAVFNGRVNATFAPLSGLSSLVARRAGDDTAQILASTIKALLPGIYKVGYTSAPAPGDYWEMAIVQVIPG